MAAMGGPTVEASPQLGQNVLIKELSASQARDELQRAAHLPKQHQKLQKHMIDVAFGHLLGLNEDDSLELEDPADIGVCFETAKMQLVEDGFPELSQRLSSLLSALNTCTACSVQGTRTQELTDKPLVTRFTEHDALLRLFISLKGSSPSIRRRQTTFQKISASREVESNNNNNNSSPFLPSNQQQALTASVFAEAPNPDALYDLHGTSVLLPYEVQFTIRGGGNSGGGAAAAAAAATATQAPESELVELSQGLDSRPSWAPASVQGLPPLYSEGWLPITPALVGMRGNTRKVVPPPPLNVPLSTLAIERTPGAVTGFSNSSSRGGSGSKDRGASIEKMNRLENKNKIVQTDGEVVDTSNLKRNTSKDKKILLGSDSLWTLEEAELARDALLALQGVHSSLLRLRGALAAAHALVHPAAAGLLKRIERAASCRHRLQGFIDTFSSLSRGNSSNLAYNNSNNNKITSSDPVLSALASGLHDVLLSFSQELSSLETSHATEWVHAVQLAAADGGPAIRGKVLQGQGLSLTRVAVITGKVQTMLRVLCSMFWCNEVTVTVENSEDSTISNSTNATMCEWEVGPGPPRGPALLSLLCRYAEEADEPYTEILHYLFARTAQPYLFFLRQWACSTVDIDLNHPYSALMPNTILLTQSAEFDDDFNFRGIIGSGSNISSNAFDNSNNANRRRNSRPRIAIPGTLPEFLARIEAQLLRTGVQLRLLHSIHTDGCRDLVAALSSSGSEIQNSSANTNTTIVDGIRSKSSFDNDENFGDGDHHLENLEEIFSKFSFSGPPVFDSLGSGSDSSSTVVININSGESGVKNHSAAAAVESDGGGGGGGGILFLEEQQLSSSSLFLLPQTPLQIEELNNQRRQEESIKGDLVNGWCSKLELERKGAEDAERGAALGEVSVATQAVAMKEAARVEALSRRESQKQELLKEQLDAIASVQLARGGGGGYDVAKSGGGAGGFREEKIQNNDDKGINVDKLETLAASVVSKQVDHVDTAGAIRDEKVEKVKKEEKGRCVEDEAAVTATIAPSSSPSPALSSEQKVPISTTIEAAFTSTISLQYRLISQACLNFFINHLQIEKHLSFLRSTFFLEAGDWADEFLKPLSSRIAALQPLSAHSVHGALQDSLSNSSLGKKEFRDSLMLVENLEAEILAGPTAISSFLTCLEKQEQKQHESTGNRIDILAIGNLPRNRASAPLLVSPTALDGLDIVLLRYNTSWPLAALLTEDTALAYAAVFSAMVRVRRVSAALTKVWSPLAPRLADAPLIRPSPKTTRRVQKLRVFVRSASQLTASVQYFQGLTTSGPSWEALSRAVASNDDSTNYGDARGNNSHSKIYNKENTRSVSDLQELLEMHRTYVFTSAVDCLTLCGREKLQTGIDAALRSALTVASKIETAVEAGRVASGPRSSESSWMHTLSNDTAWNAIETSIHEFENAVKVIRKELTIGVGVSGPLAGLAAMLH